MKNIEIQDFNHRCAEFLGLKRGWWIPQVKPLTYDKKQWWDIDGKTFLGTKVYYNKDLRFHLDWNWIMEVVEAIEKLKFNSDTCTNSSPFFTIGKHWCYIHIYNDTENGVPESGKYYYWSSGQHSIMGETKKEALIKTIDQFLIWYEKQK